jgi:hypothetical protein
VPEHTSNAPTAAIDALRSPPMSLSSHASSVLFRRLRKVYHDAA